MKLLHPVSNIVNHRPWVVVGTVLLATFLMLGLTILKPAPTEFDNSQWAPDSEEITALESIEDHFPARAYNVPVLVHATTPADQPNVLTSAFMVEILQLQLAMASNPTVSVILVEEQPFVGLPNLLAMVVDPQASTLEQLIETFQGMSDAQVQAAYQTALTLPQLGEFVSSLMSLDNQEDPKLAEATIMMVTLDTSYLPGETDKQRLERYEKVEATLDSIVESQHPTHSRSMVITAFKIDKESMEADEEAAATLLPIAFLVIIIILALTYRSFSDLAFSLLALIFTLIWVQGFTSLLQLSPSPMMVIVPIVLIGLGVDFGIHLTMRYREQLVKGNDIKKAGTVAILGAGVALFLAAITDAIGFLSNLSSSIIFLREFGIIISLGIASAFLIFVTFVPASRILLDRRRQAKGKGLLSATNVARAQRDKDQFTGLKARIARVTDLGAYIALRRPKTALTAVTGLTLVMMLFATQVTTTFSYYDFLAPDTELTQEVMYMDSNFEFSDETVIIYLEDDDLATPEIFAALAATQENLGESDEKYILYRGGGGFTSPLAILQDLANGSDVAQGGLYDPVFAANYTANDTDGDGIPDTNLQGLIDEVWETYPGLLNSSLARDEATGKYFAAQMTIKVNTQGISQTTRVNELIKEDIAPLNELESSGVLDTVIITGEPIIIDVVIGAINESMVVSTLITVVVSALVLTLVFWFSDRSLTLGIITILPVIMVLVWIQGTMYLLDIPRNVLTLMLGAITIGLGVSYAIHTTHRFTDELKEHGDPARAARKTVRHTGNAQLGAALSTMAGFGVLALSPQTFFQQFGTLTALTILYSFTVSVFIQPSLLVLWAKAVTHLASSQKTVKDVPVKPLPGTISGIRQPIRFPLLALVGLTSLHQVGVEQEPVKVQNPTGKPGSSKPQMASLSIQDRMAR